MRGLQQQGETHGGQCGLQACSFGGQRSCSGDTVSGQAQVPTHKGQSVHSVAPAVALKVPGLQATHFLPLAEK